MSKYVIVRVCMYACLQTYVNRQAKLCPGSECPIVLFIYFISNEMLGLKKETVAALRQT